LLYRKKCTYKSQSRLFHIHARDHNTNEGNLLPKAGTNKKIKATTSPKAGKNKKKKALTSLEERRELAQIGLRRLLLRRENSYCRRPASANIFKKDKFKVR
jgi:hypothetical protein